MGMNDQGGFLGSLFGQSAPPDYAGLLNVRSTPLPPGVYQGGGATPNAAMLGIRSGAQQFQAPTGMPGAQGMLGPQGMGSGGFMQQAAAQQQPGSINLTPQMIQQILQSMAARQQQPGIAPNQGQVGTLSDLQQARGMMGVGGQRR